MAQEIKSAYSPQEWSESDNWFEWLTKLKTGPFNLNDDFQKITSKNQLPKYLTKVPQNQKVELLEAMFDVNAASYDPSGQFGMRYKRFRLGTAMQLYFESESKSTSLDEFIKLEVTRRVLPLTLSREDLVIVNEIVEYVQILTHWGTSLYTTISERLLDSSKRHYENLAIFSRHLKEEGQICRVFFQEYVTLLHIFKDDWIVNPSHAFNHLATGILPTILTNNQLVSIYEKNIVNVQEDPSMEKLKDKLTFIDGTWISDPKFQDDVNKESVKYIFNFYKSITDIRGRDSWFLVPTRKENPWVYFFLYYYNSTRTFPFHDAELEFFKDLQLKSHNVIVEPPKLIKSQATYEGEKPNVDNWSMGKDATNDNEGLLSFDFWNKLQDDAEDNEEILMAKNNLKTKLESINKNILDGFFKGYQDNIVKKYTNSKSRNRANIKFNVYDEVTEWGFDDQKATEIEDTEENEDFEKHLKTIKDDTYNNDKKMEYCSNFTDLHLDDIKSFNKIFENCTDESLKHIASIVPFLSRQTCIDVAKVFMGSPRFNVTKNAYIMMKKKNITLESWKKFPEFHDDDQDKSKWRTLAWVCEMELVSSIRHLVDVLNLEMKDERVRRELAYASLVRGAIHRAANLTETDHGVTKYTDMLKVVPQSDYKLDSSKIQLEMADVYGAHNELACINKLNIVEKNQEIFLAMSQSFGICEKMLASNPFFVLNSQYLIKHHSVLTRFTCSTLLAWISDLVPSLASLLLPEEGYFSDPLPELDQVSMLDFYPNMAFAEDYLNTLEVIKDILFLSNSSTKLRECQITLVAYVNHVRMQIKKQRNGDLTWHDVFLHPVQLAIFCLIGDLYINIQAKEKNSLKTSSEALDKPILRERSEKEVVGGATKESNGIENDDGSDFELVSDEEEESDSDEKLDSHIIAQEMEDFIASDSEDVIVTDNLPLSDEVSLEDDDQIVEFKKMNCKELLEIDEDSEIVNPYHYTSAFNNLIFPFKNENRNFPFKKESDVSKFRFRTCLAEIRDWRNASSYSRPIVRLPIDSSNVMGSVANKLLITCLKALRAHKLDLGDSSKPLGWGEKNNIVSRILGHGENGSSDLTTMHINDFLFYFLDKKKFAEDPQDAITEMIKQDAKINDKVNVSKKQRNSSKKFGLQEQRSMQRVITKYDKNVPVVKKIEEYVSVNPIEKLFRDKDNKTIRHTGTGLHRYISSVPIDTIEEYVRKDIYKIMGFNDNQLDALREISDIAGYLQYCRYLLKYCKNESEKGNFDLKFKLHRIFPGPFVNPAAYIDRSKKDSSICRDISWTEGSTALTSHLDETEKLIDSLYERMGSDNIPDQLKSKQSNPSILMQTFKSKLSELIDEFKTNNKFKDPKETSEETKKLWRQHAPRFLHEEFLEDVPNTLSNLEALKMHTLQVAVVVLVIEFLKLNMQSFTSGTDSTQKNMESLEKLCSYYYDTLSVSDTLKRILLKHPALWNVHDVMILLQGFDLLKKCSNFDKDKKKYLGFLTGVIEKLKLANLHEDAEKLRDKIFEEWKQSKRAINYILNDSERMASVHGWVVDCLMYSNHVKTFCFKKIADFVKATQEISVAGYDDTWPWIKGMYPPSMQILVDHITQGRHAAAWNMVDSAYAINLKYNISTMKRETYTFSTTDENKLGNFEIKYNENNTIHQVHLYSATLGDECREEIIGNINKSSNTKKRPNETEGESAIKKRRTDTENSTISTSGKLPSTNDTENNKVKSIKPKCSLKYDGRSWEMLTTGNLDLNNSDKADKAKKALCSMYNTYVSSLLFATDE